MQHRCVRASGGRPAGGEVSELPIKANDHAMDATRYALHTALARVGATEAWLAAWLHHRREE